MIHHFPCSLANTTVPIAPSSPVSTLPSRLVLWCRTWTTATSGRTNLLNVHALVTVPEWPSEQRRMNLDQLVVAGDPLTEHVDKVAVVHKCPIHEWHVVLVPGRLHG